MLLPNVPFSPLNFYPFFLKKFRFWQLPYYWAGIKAYDFVSGRQCLKTSFIMSKERALEMFPMLKRDKLKGGIVYYDGSHNDARWAQITKKIYYENFILDVESHQKF